MNKEIENIQSNLGLFLIELIPVEWKRICFYAECEDGHNNFWYCFQENNTSLIITSDFFYNRYKNYSYTKSKTNETLANLTFELYEAYKKEFGKNKIWTTMTYVIESNRKIEIDFGYDLPDNSLKGILSKRKKIVNKYFDKDYIYTKEKYPY